MPAFALTAAEIAAAEAAAIAAAEAAAIQAAQVAAAEAAAAAAAEAAAAQAATQAAAQAGTQAAAQAGTQAATQASTSGIQALAQEVGATVQPTGIETLNVAQAPVDVPPGFTPVGQASVDTAMSAITPAPNMSAQAVTPNFDPTKPFANPTLTTPPADFGAGTGEALGRGSYASSSASAAPTPASTIPPRPDNALYQFQGPTTPEGLQTGARLDSALRPSGDPFYNINSGHIDQTFGRPGFGVNDVAVEPSAVSSALPAQPATGLQGLIDKSIAYAKDNPLQTGFGAMSLYNMLNQPKPYKKEKYKSTFDSSTYRPYEPTPPNPPYRPQYPQYAQGGLADLGGYADYAHGGRMLKGPGDGMSDDIPATIAGKQPARLANEEFVIPADVVSHLGNGSSEAGAKALYKMMDRVRQARTGNKKQGKQINPEKFLA
jgi:hypothetical protein